MKITFYALLIYHVHAKKNEYMKTLEIISTQDKKIIGEKK
jgi:hypothetical protein